MKERYDISSKGFIIPLSFCGDEKMISNILETNMWDAVIDFTNPENKSLFNLLSFVGKLHIPAILQQLWQHYQPQCFYFPKQINIDPNDYFDSSIDLYQKYNILEGVAEFLLSIEEAMQNNISEESEKRLKIGIDQIHALKLFTFSNYLNCIYKASLLEILNFIKIDNPRLLAYQNVLKEILKDWVPNLYQQLQTEKELS